jgi:Kef-type K+ transport system membrane component KefB
MSFSSVDLAHLLLALTILLVAAHALGHMFTLLRQPAVIGEIIGGLLLGPTVLGAISPNTQASLFPKSGVTAVGLGMMYELGLLLLMFLSGSEMRTYRNPGQQKTVASMAVLGIVLPFAVGLAAVQFIDYADWSGPRGTSLTFALVFGIGIAVTSIPVISRIMLDLGILHTTFARIVLFVAVLEDILLYVALSVIVGMVQGSSGEQYGLPSLFRNSSTEFVTAYHVAAAALFFAIFFPLGHRLFRVLSKSRLNLLEKRSPTAFRISFLLGMVLVCFLVGINPIFGALLAGTAATSVDDRSPDEYERDRADRAWSVLKKFSLAFFIPLYFAGVGIKLDLLHHFDAVFFVVFFLLACVVKLSSVWLGARLAGTPNRSALNFAVALNARGGPGIVLATVTLSVGVINEDFFSILVVLSIATSQLAGLWLQHVFMPQLISRHDGGSHVHSTEAEGKQPVRGAGSKPDAGAP